MRRHYRHELSLLEQELLALGRLCEHSMQRTMWALRQHAPDEARAIIHDDNAIDDAATELTDHATSLIAREGPVARDLRLLTSFILVPTSWNGSGIMPRVLRAWLFGPNNHYRPIFVIAWMPWQPRGGPCSTMPWMHSQPAMLRSGCASNTTMIRWISSTMRSSNIQPA
ncbi:MAG: hypothetical protein HC822_11140 [Oscillochloris sp.]|nr:hypothetical protein [Oscillochloris sp.]